MTELTIAPVAETTDTWQFTVTVQEHGSATQHTVTIDKAYCRQLGSAAAPEPLLRRSFEFLLAREPKESILRQFNLHDIARYFPDFEEKIQP